MAYPQYGGTNGVTELDLGQAGGTRATAGDARYNPRVIVGGVQTREVKNELPQQNFTLVDNLGTVGYRVAWQANLAVADDEALAAVESDLWRAKTGMAIAAGVPQAFDDAQIAATRLTNKAGRVLSEKARLKDFKFGKQMAITTGEGFTISVPLTVEFEGLG